MLPELTIEHVRLFAPYQLFEMAAPNGESYLLELQEEDVDAAIAANQFKIKNLAHPQQPLAVVGFDGLKQMLKAIKTYQPCWTNQWSRLVH